MMRVAAGLLAALASLWLSITWIEAEKEVVVLCGLGRVGTSVAEVQRLHGTASLSNRRVDSVATRVTTTLASSHNLSLTTCTVTVEDGVVTTSNYRERFRLAPLDGLRRSLRMEDRAPPSLLSVLTPRSLAAQLLAGAATLLCAGAFLAVLGIERQRQRWLKAALLLLLLNLGGVLLIGS